MGDGAVNEFFSPSKINFIEAKERDKETGQRTSLEIFLKASVPASWRSWKTRISVVEM